MFYKLKRLSLLAIAATITGCSVVSPTQGLYSPYQLCTNYLIYEMCGKDLNRDTQTDFFYFGDDNQVFLLNESFDPASLPKPFVLHPCVQVMGPKFQEVANDTLSPTVQADPIEATLVKQRLIGHYLRRLSSINACQAERGRGMESEDDFLDGF